MKKVVDINEAIKIARRIRRKKERIILTGGCFDILHIGHIKFLGAAKELGERVFVLLESDEKVKKLKGNNRPIFTQKDRAETLSSLKDADIIVNLPNFSSDYDYQSLIEEIKPDIIAVTENDPIIFKKRNYAEKIGAQLKAIPYVKSLSSSKLAEILSKEHI